MSMTLPVVSCRAGVQVEQWRWSASYAIRRFPLGFVDVNRVVRLRQVARSLTILGITEAIERREAGFETGVWRLS